MKEGLLPTDRVIVNGMVRAKPGAKVTPQDGRAGARRAPATSAQKIAAAA